MVPLLIRGLRHNETPIKRKTTIIIANMSKLVNNPADATVFLPRLLPGVKVWAQASLSICVHAAGACMCCVRHVHSQPFSSLFMIPYVSVSSHQFYNLFTFGGPCR